MAKVTVYAGLGRWLARNIDTDLELEAIAGEVSAAAIGLAAEHIETGDFARSIHIRKDRLSPSGRDRLVYSDDPAALSIEFGHNVRTSDGGLRPVDGLHILGRAADSV